MTAARLTVPSPLGPLTLVASGGAIVRLDWGAAEGSRGTALLESVCRRLEAYFAGAPDDFADLPLLPAGSPFLRRVCAAMRRIPYGETWSYGRLAASVASSARAVGGACGRNPIPILIPCHRVVGGAGALTGYSGAGGLDTKRFLLALEQSAGLA